MDIKEKIQEIVKKIQSDKDFASKFQKDPVKALESVTGLDLPDDKINEVINAVKAKVSFDTLSDLGASLFGKK